MKAREVQETLPPTHNGANRRETDALLAQGLRNKYKAAQKRVIEMKEIIKTYHRFYGYSFVSSFDVNKSQNISEAIAMGNCIQAVIECDTIYLDHDWQSSKGRNLEYRAAKIYDK